MLGEARRQSGVGERQDLSRQQALRAPASPTARVPTGTPAGIWAIDRRESRPSWNLEAMGTPSTGRSVIEAVMPGRCAAPPAPAIITLIPAFLAPLAKA